MNRILNQTIESLGVRRREDRNNTVLFIESL
jgi:hypothetical protein